MNILSDHFNGFDDAQGLRNGLADWTSDQPKPEQGDADYNRYYDMVMDMRGRV